MWTHHIILPFFGAFVKSFLHFYLQKKQKNDKFSLKGQILSASDPYGVKIQKIRRGEDEFNALEIEPPGLIVGGVDVTEVALVYSKIVENIYKLAHGKIHPKGWKMEKYGYW